MQCSGGTGGVEFNNLDTGIARRLYVGDSNGVGIHGLNSDSFTAEDNLVEGGARTVSTNGIDNGGATVVRIRRNTVRNILHGDPAHEQRGILVHHTQDCIIEDNISEYNGHQGIVVASSSNVLVQGNTCSNNGQYNPTQAEGIKIWALQTFTSQITVRQNRCYDDQELVQTQRFGIKVEANPGLTIDALLVEDNNFANNAVQGIVQIGNVTNYQYINNLE